MTTSITYIFGNKRNTFLTITIAALLSGSVRIKGSNDSNKYQISAAERNLYSGYVTIRAWREKQAVTTKRVKYSLATLLQPLRLISLELPTSGDTHFMILFRDWG